MLLIVLGLFSEIDFLIPFNVPRSVLR